MENEIKIFTRFRLLKLDFYKKIITFELKKSIIMKKIVFLFVVILSFNLRAQNVKQLITSGKWYVVSTQENGKQPEEADSKEDEWIIFLPNGTTEEEHFGENENSKWVYSDKNKTMKIIGSSTYLNKLIEITKDRMVVEVIEKGQPDIIITYEK